MPHWMFVFNIVASCLWAFQIIFGFLSFLKTKWSKSVILDHVPHLSVVIPAFNEKDSTVQKVVDSVIIQQNVEVEVFVIDDGSCNPLSIQKHSKVTLLRLDQNQGKRSAQVQGVYKANYDWIVTVDSDTVLNPNALYELYKAAIVNKWDGVTGNVKLLNEHRNLLTRMIACLYWYGFNQERASHSFFGRVTCCSGALSLWRKQTILDTCERYMNQTFLKRKCIAGDDRFLTCLFATEQKRVGCALRAVAYTISPDTLYGFIRQQLRWTRSFSPAFLFALKNIRRISWLFIIFMLAVTFRYSYFAVLYICVFLALFLGHWHVPFVVFLAILAVSGLKSTNAFLYTRDFKMFYLMPLSLLAFFVLSPVVIYGVFTPTSTGWLTRAKEEIPKIPAKKFPESP
jgi:hyaluronan synthase